jgi:hypothetical protein
MGYTVPTVHNSLGVKISPYVQSWCSRPNVQWILTFRVIGGAENCGTMPAFFVQEIAEYKKLDGANGRFWVVKPEVSTRQWNLFASLG